MGYAERVKMNISNEFKEITSKSNEDLPWDFDPARKEEIALLCRNEEDTLEFIEKWMDGEDLSFISEVFEEVFEQIYSECLVAALYKGCDRFPEEDKRWYIRLNLDAALEDVDV